MLCFNRQQLHLSCVLDAAYTSIGVCLPLPTRHPTDLLRQEVHQVSLLLAREVTPQRLSHTYARNLPLRRGKVEADVSREVHNLTAKYQVLRSD